MNRGSTKKQRLEGQQHYDELESDIDRRASERFHRKPYQSYTVDDYLKKMGFEVVEGAGNVPTAFSRCRWTRTF